MTYKIKFKTWLEMGAEMGGELPSVTMAIRRLNQPGMHARNRQQAEGEAGNLWFNMSQAREDFENPEEFITAVGDAWENQAA